MKYPNELEHALTGAAAEYRFETGDNNFTCLAKIKVEKGWSDVSIINDFTLTAEEVETVQYGLEEAISSYKEYMRKWEGRRDLSEYKFYIHQSNNILTRIKQWQDDNG